MDGESEDRQKEEDSRIDLFKADNVLKGSPNEAEGCTAQETWGGYLSQVFIIIEVNIAIVLKDNLDKVAETHRQS